MHSSGTGLDDELLLALSGPFSARNLCAATQSLGGERGKERKKKEKKQSGAKSCMPFSTVSRAMGRGNNKGGKKG